MNNRIKEIWRLIVESQNHIDDLKKELIELAPIKVGETINPNYYSYLGKKMIVTSIIIKETPWSIKNKWEWVAYGNIIKSDGTPGKQVGESVYKPNI